MRTRTRWIWLALIGSILTVQPANALQVGDQAPLFELEGSDGRTYALADELGQSAVVLAWYPRAFTSGCTLECKSLTEDGDLIRAMGVRFFMVSVDPVSENARFAEAMSANFPLLSDPTKETARAYGVLHQNRFALRTTFYIGADGTILRIDRNVNPANAARDIATALASLGFESESAQKTKETLPTGAAEPEATD